MTFETIEHLEEPASFIARLCRWTRRTVLASVPVVPTRHGNPFHLHDFERGELPRMFAVHGWRCIQTLDQSQELTEIYVFERE